MENQSVSLKHVVEKPKVLVVSQEMNLVEEIQKNFQFVISEVVCLSVMMAQLIVVELHLWYAE